MEQKSSEVPVFRNWAKSQGQFLDLVSPTSSWFLNLGDKTYFFIKILKY